MEESARSLITLDIRGFNSLNSYFGVFVYYDEKLEKPNSDLFFFVSHYCKRPIQIMAKSPTAMDNVVE